MNSETDIDTQINAVDNFITQDVDLICLAPADSVGLVAPAKHAIDAGITVVNFDVKLDDKALADAGLTGLPLRRSRQRGRRLPGRQGPGRQARQGRQGRHHRGQPRRRQRQDAQGRLRAGRHRKVGLELLESTTAHWETEEANTLMTNLITKYPDMQGVMAANDSMALGVVKAIDAAGLTGKIEVVGFDNIPAVQDARSSRARSWPPSTSSAPTWPRTASKPASAR